MVTLRDVLPYDDLGWSLIPMVLGAEKKPACRRWKPYQTTRPDRATLRRWFGKGRPGVAVVFGEISGGESGTALVSRDFDQMDAYDRWAARCPQLAAALPTVATRRGRHVYGLVKAEDVTQLRRAIGKPAGIGAIDCGDGELRAGVGRYSVLPPSRHPSGHVYQWLRSPFEVPLPIIQLEDAGFFEPAVTKCSSATESNRELRRATETTEDNRSH